LNDEKKTTLGKMGLHLILEKRKKLGGKRTRIFKKEKRESAEQG